MIIELPRACHFPPAPVAPAGRRGISVSSYVPENWKGYIEQTESVLGTPVPLGLAEKSDLIGLRKNLMVFVQITTSIPGKDSKVPERKKAQQTATPQRLARDQIQRNGTHKHMYAPSPRIPLHPKGRIPQKDTIRHECGRQDIGRVTVLILTRVAKEVQKNNAPLDWSKGKKGT
ncbi:hypothetical protein Tco_0097020 [Tanacetum coccineum]